MMLQWKYFFSDISRVLGRKKYRIFIIFFTRSFWGLLSYRFERSLFLFFGKYYAIIRLPFIPLFFIFQVFSNIEIHYKASIEGGILILHPSIGIVISGRAKIGKNLTLVGGNVIGLNEKSEGTFFLIGDNCYMGSNSVILGPIELGNNITIGASSCVVKSFLTENSTLVGVPAKALSN